MHKWVHGHEELYVAGVNLQSSSAIEIKSSLRSVRGFREVGNLLFLDVGGVHV